MKTLFTYLIVVLAIATGWLGFNPPEVFRMPVEVTAP